MQNGITIDNNNNKYSIHEDYLKYFALYDEYIRCKAIDDI